MNDKTKSSSDPLYAVLTGDIINSSALSGEKIKSCWEVISQTQKGFIEHYGPVIIGSPDFYRGDSWQILIDQPALSLRFALLLRARLKSEIETDTRIAIGIGSVETIHPQNISMSQGEAFTLSGQSLDDISGYFNLTGQLPDKARPMAEWFQVILYLCSEFVQSWTRRQAEIVSVALLLEPPKHAEIAKSLSPPVAKQTVTDSLKGAHWRALWEVLRVFETTIWANFVKLEEDQTGI